MTSGKEDRPDAPLEQAKQYSQERSNNKVRKRLEAQTGEEDVLAEQREVQVVLPAVHLHHVRASSGEE